MHSDISNVKQGNMLKHGGIGKDIAINQVPPLISLHWPHAQNLKPCAIVHGFCVSFQEPLIKWMRIKAATQEYDHDDIWFLSLSPLSLSLKYVQSITET